MAGAPLVGRSAVIGLEHRIMSLEPSDLLARLSTALRSDIGPAVVDDYARTQAFMASVILERVSRQLALQREHTAAEADDMAGLLRALPAVLDGSPPAVASAVRTVESRNTVASLGALIEALYSWGAGEQAVIAALGLIRGVLRRDIDRKMAVAL